MYIDEWQIALPRWVDCLDQAPCCMVDARLFSEQVHCRNPPSYQWSYGTPCHSPRWLRALRISRRTYTGGSCPLLAMSGICLGASAVGDVYFVWTL